MTHSRRAATRSFSLVSVVMLELQIEGHVERPDQRDERLPSARSTLPPNLCGEQGLAVTLHDGLPIRSVGKRLALVVAHLAGPQEAEINQDDRHTVGVVPLDHDQLNR
jgi:hypothetical protein